MPTSLPHVTSSPLAALMAIVLVLGCGAEPERKVRAPPHPAPAAKPDAQEPAESSMQAADPRLDLALPMLGQRREQLLRTFPACAESWNPELSLCRFHRSIGDLPLSKQCEDGCTWRTYEFTAGRLSHVHIKREVFDASPEFVAAFTEEAKIVAETLSSQVGKAAGEQVDLATWDETATHGEWIILSQQRWQLESGTLTWKLLQAPGHHPGVLLHIELQSTEPH